MSPKLSDRLSKLFPMLASDHDGEILSTVRAIRTALASEGLDLHDLAKRLLNGASKSVSDIIDEAYAAAARSAARAAAWSAEDVRREAREAAAKRADEDRREAREEEVTRAEKRAAEKAAKKAAKSAERATPEFKARFAELRRQAKAKKAAEAALAASEREKADRIARVGPKWDDLSDSPRRAWVKDILRDPSAKLDPSTTAALNGIESALAPAQPKRRGAKITFEMIKPEWIAEFEKAARDYTMRRGMRQ